MKVKGLIVLAALVFSGVAQARPSTYKMTCAQAQGLVQSHGAIVMNYGYSEAAGHLYHRFVAHGGYCSHHEKADRAWVPTTDRRNCPVGYVCKTDWDSNN